MLDACAPGWTKTETEHHYCVKWKGRTYPSLSKGKHGKKAGAGEVQVGQVRQLVRQFGIINCAKKHLGVLQ